MGARLGVPKWCACSWLRWGGGADCAGVSGGDVGFGEGVEGVEGMVRVWKVGGMRGRLLVCECVAGSQRNEWRWVQGTGQGIAGVGVSFIGVCQHNLLGPSKSAEKIRARHSTYSSGQSKEIARWSWREPSRLRARGSR
jgi:hypothetical protein